MPINFGAGPSTLPPDYPELAGWLAALAAVLALVAYFMAEGRPALRRWAWYAAFTSIGIAGLGAIAAVMDW